MRGTWYINLRTGACPQTLSDFSRKGQVREDTKTQTHVTPLKEIQASLAEMGETVQQVLLGFFPLRGCLLSVCNHLFNFIFLISSYYFVQICFHFYTKEYFRVDFCNKSHIKLPMIHRNMQRG